MRIMLLADIHIGSIADTKYVYDTLIRTIDEEVCFNKTDMIVILGDYFHKLFKGNDSYISLAVNIMSHIVRLCKRDNTKLRIIYGTESHEMGQYHIFNHHLTSNAVDMKVITTCMSETINGKDILYVPEEYMTDKHDFYREHFNNRYDYIFGHGVIIEGMAMVKYSENKNNIEKKVPHFKSMELSSISKICVFGHYHEFTDLKDDCYYLGSFFRDSFGQETPKGYGIIEDDIFAFKENSAAIEFNTHVIDEAEMSIDDIISKVKNICNSKSSESERIRLVFNNVDDNVLFRDNIRNALNDSENITIVIKNVNDVILDDVKEDIDPKYDFILDDSIDIIDKIDMYIKENYEIKISDIRKYIN